MRSRDSMMLCFLMVGRPFLWSGARCCLETKGACSSGREGQEGREDQDGRHRLTRFLVFLAFPLSLYCFRLLFACFAACSASLRARNSFTASSNSFELSERIA